MTSAGICSTPTCDRNSIPAEMKNYQVLWFPIQIEKKYRIQIASRITYILTWDVFHEFKIWQVTNELKGNKYKQIYHTDPWRQNTHHSRSFKNVFREFEAFIYRINYGKIWEMPQGRHKTPFSSKQKKIQLQQKRSKKQSNDVAQGTL